MRWTVLIPAKSLPAAKSRLAASTGDAEAHESLVRALRADTIAAARSAHGVARVVAVVDAPGSDIEGADLVLVQSGSGLNDALREGWRACAARWPADGVAALVGDLPALRPEELTAALAEAAAAPCAYVADSQSTGTTLLTARPGARLEPHFGAGSAARHSRFAASVAAGPGLRQDVDTDSDLVIALRIGVGPHTTAVAARRPSLVHFD